MTKHPVTSLDFSRNLAPTITRVMQFILSDHQRVEQPTQRIQVEARHGKREPNLKRSPNIPKQAFKRMLPTSERTSFDDSASRFDIGFVPVSKSTRLTAPS